MSVAIDKAIFTRWNNTSLDNTVTGGLWPGRSQEVATNDMPYASYEVVSDPAVGFSRTTRYHERTIQISVWDDTRNKVGSHADAIVAALVYSDRAATNPTATTDGGGTIKNIELDSEPIIIQESDDVWQAVIIFVVTYAKVRALSPA